MGLLLLVIFLGLAGFLWLGNYHPAAAENMPVACAPAAPQLGAGQTLKVLTWNVQTMSGKNYVFWSDLPGNDGPDEKPSETDISATFAELVRVRGQLTELRAADLRFMPAEVAEFLNRMMGLNLSAEDIAALEIRTEGWIAGLQLAALSMQGHQDTSSFIKSFTGSHHFVLDYLIEDVLQQQSESVQAFLLSASIQGDFAAQSVSLNPLSLVFSAVMFAFSIGMYRLVRKREVTRN